MNQAVHQLAVLVAFLALLNVVSVTLCRVLKFAAKPVPKESSRQVAVLVLGAGIAACFLMLVAICLLYLLVAPFDFRCLG